VREVKRSDFEFHYPLTLSKLPCWQDLSDEQYRQRIRQMCAKIADDAELARQESGAKVLGVKAVLRSDAHHIPDQIDRSPAPPVHCTDRAARRLFLEAYRRFCDAYRCATAMLRQGIEVFQFPEQGIPHGCHFCPDSG
jgi:hypothetical protein